MRIRWMKLSWNSVFVATEIATRSLVGILISSLLTRSSGTWAFSAVSQPLCIWWRLPGIFCKNTSSTGVDKWRYKLRQPSLLLEAESTSFSGHYCWLQPCFPHSPLLVWLTHKRQSWGLKDFPVRMKLIECHVHYCSFKQLRLSYSGWWEERKG